MASDLSARRFSTSISEIFQSLSMALPLTVSLTNHSICTSPRRRSFGRGRRLALFLSTEAAWRTEGLERSLDNATRTRHLRTYNCNTMCRWTTLKVTDSTREFSMLRFLQQLMFKGQRPRQHRWKNCLRVGRLSPLQGNGTSVIRESEMLASR